jgi:hypothetical protein
MRIPGFAQAVEPEAIVSRPRSDEALSRRTPTRPLSVRVMAPLVARYKRLARDLDDEGFDTTVTELVHALLESGPATPDEARALVRRWRRILDGD